MAYDKSVVLFTTPQIWALARTALTTRGYELGDGVPLEPIDTGDGSLPAPYLGSHSMETAETAAFLLGQVQLDFPDYTQEEVQGLLSMLNVTVDPVIQVDGADVTLTKRAHFDHAISAAGLQVVQAEI